MMTITRRPNDLEQEFFCFEFDHPGVAPVAATGTITCATDAAAGDGDILTIDDGFRKVVYEYDKSSNGVTAGRVSWAAGTTAASNATALKLLIEANQPAFTVTDNLAGVLTLTHRWPGAGGNATILETGTVIASLTGMTGGVDAASHNATYAKKLMTAQRSMLVDKVEYINPTGLAGHASNYWEVALKKDSTVMAQWSTDSDVVGQGTLTANAIVNPVIVTAQAVALAGAVLSLALTKVASAANLPAGRIVIHGRYV